MKIMRVITVFLLVLMAWALPCQAGFGDILKKAQESIGGLSGSGGAAGLSTGEIIDGLKEALKVGTSNTVGVVSKSDGYFGNSDIRIPMPGSISKYEKYLRMAGLGNKLDAFEMPMNRAAEAAAPKAKTIFWGAVKQMTFEDAKGILSGPDDAATRYFEKKTTEPLTQAFKPIVHDAMGKVGVTKKYQELTGKISALPMATSISAFDLDSYVTGGALKGLFHMLALEEKDIRTNPTARVSDILKKVFN